MPSGASGGAGRTRATQDQVSEASAGSVDVQLSTFQKKKDKEEGLTWKRRGGGGGRGGASVKSERGGVHRRRL